MLLGILVLIVMCGIGWLFGFLGLTLRRGVEGLKFIKSQEHEARMKGYTIDQAKRHALRGKSLLSITWPLLVLIAFYAITFEFALNYRVFALILIIGVALVCMGYNGYFLTPGA